MGRARATKRMVQGSLAAMLLLGGGGHLAALDTAGAVSAQPAEQSADLAGKGEALEMPVVQLSLEQARRLVSEAAKQGGTAALRLDEPGKAQPTVQMVIPTEPLKLLVEGKVALSLRFDEHKLTLSVEQLQDVLESKGRLELKFGVAENREEEKARWGEMTSSAPLRDFFHYYKVKVSMNKSLHMEGNFSGSGELTVSFESSAIPSSYDIHRTNMVIADKRELGDTKLQPAVLEFTEDGRRGEVSAQVRLDSSADYKVLLLSGLNQRVTISKYVSGADDGRFSPDKPVSRAEFVNMMTAAFGIGSSDFPKDSVTFKDIPKSHPAYPSIGFMESAGVLKGDAKGYFHPEQPLSRSEAAVFLARFFKLELPSSIHHDFKDIENHWAAREIQAAVNKGVMKGIGNGRFEPERICTRAEAVILLDRVVKMNGERSDFLHDPGQLWSDVPPSHPAYAAIQSASVTREVEFTLNGANERIIGK
ncbi:S-layer homology domain-containing protein [Paenibacillus sp. CAA11]|uniref:S-layer homology domain-containing protein n=1 Tax=Paenibacillus sp. CAA11 TaxID=1532905 RepID=UPI00131F1AE0|nr:S-layer homology domain-containing protein [Paenibacillus sp. CAA11]